MATVMDALLPEPEEADVPDDPAAPVVGVVDPVLLLDDELQAAARKATIPITAIVLSTPLARTLTSETFTTTEDPPPGSHFEYVRSL
jgi:hypothetical protein